MGRHTAGDDGCTQCPWTTVIGIVSDVKYNGLDQPNQGTVYWNLVGAYEGNRCQAHAWRQPAERAAHGSRRGMTIVGAGVLVGVIVAALSTRLMSTLLFGVSPGDVATLLGVAIFLLLMALAACLVPARRAINLQPAAVLRNE